MQHTHDIADMIATGDIRAAWSMHAAYVDAATESDADLLDQWMAGALLEAVSAQYNAAA